jgi:hypothetical protein
MHRGVLKLQRLKTRPRWVTGLRPRIEELFDGTGVREGLLIGEGRIRGDMVQIVRLKFASGRVKRPLVEVEGADIRFIYPLKGGESIDRIYYPLVGLLSKI